MTVSEEVWNGPMANWCDFGEDLAHPQDAGTELKKCCFSRISLKLKMTSTRFEIGDFCCQGVRIWALDLLWK